MKTKSLTPAQNAAAFLLEYADEIKEGCRSGKRHWVCGDCTVVVCCKRRYDEVRAAAKALVKPK